MQAAVSVPPPAARANARFFGRRELIASIVGTLLYAGLTWFTSFAPLSTGFGFDLRPGIVIPIVFGFMYGPVVGFAVGFLGNALADRLNWQEAWGPFLFYWNWHVGNGIMGLIPGLYARFRRQYHSLRDILIAVGVGIVAIIVGMGFAAFSAIPICPADTTNPICDAPGADFQFYWDVAFVPTLRVNIISMLILLPVLLFNYDRLDLRSTDWAGSGLLRRLLGAILISAALPIALLGIFLLQQISTDGAESNLIVARILGTIVVSLLFTVANAMLVAQTISGPLLRLGKAAELMAAGNLNEETAEQLRKTEGQDEIAKLSRVFGQMALDVIQREQSLRMQVVELQIQLDEHKLTKDVGDIVDSDFFRDLRSKATNIRTRKTGSTPSVTNVTADEDNERK